jgi:hypothetical protein
LESFSSPKSFQIQVVVKRFLLNSITAQSCHKARALRYYASPRKELPVQIQLRIEDALLSGVVGHAVVEYFGILVSGQLAGGQRTDVAVRHVGPKNGMYVDDLCRTSGKQP